MASNVETVPGVIEAFFNEPVWQVSSPDQKDGKKMEGLIRFGLSDTLEALAVTHKEACEDILWELSEKTRNDDIAHLKPDDGSLREAQSWLADYRPDDDFASLFRRLDCAEADYNEAIAARAFILEKLVPALITLRVAESPPTPDDLQIIKKGYEEVSWVYKNFGLEGTYKDTAKITDTFFIKLISMVAAVPSVSRGQKTNGEAWSNGV